MNKPKLISLLEKLLKLTEPNTLLHIETTDTISELKKGGYSINYSSGFTTYDSPGCCAFCGSMRCSGGCFK